MHLNENYKKTKESVFFLQFLQLQVTGRLELAKNEDISSICFLIRL